MLKKSEFYIGFYTYKLNPIISMKGRGRRISPYRRNCAPTNGRCFPLQLKKEAVSRGNGFADKIQPFLEVVGNRNEARADADLRVGVVHRNLGIVLARDRVDALDVEGGVVGA